MDSSSSTGSPGASSGAIRTKKAAIAKRACDQCKFRKIKVMHPQPPSTASIDLPQV